jgi:tetratricopeptide (TPR) repeat protein
VGVVHRDIKPANLLLDLHGNLWITDFGLARLPTDAGLTVTGALVGTLRYMSPEQALGHRGVLDHRTDIYALGVTLYELLTLEPAFPALERHELLAQIEHDEPRAPRRLNRAVPADLETIVTKAMAKEPEGRYASAQDLAEDLRRFLEDRPILARRPSLWRRAARWARRHRALVRASGAVLLLALAGLAVGVGLIWQQKRETEEALLHARDMQTLAEKKTHEVENALGRAREMQILAESQTRETEKALDRARAMQGMAEEAVEHMLSEVAEQWLADEVRGQHLQRQFLEKALEYYQRIAAEHGTHPRLREQTARAYVRVGNLQQKLGKYADAEAAYKRAIPLCEELVREFPDAPAHRKTLAACLNGQGILWDQTGLREAAMRAYGRARDLLAPLATPNNPSYQDDLASFLSNLASVLDGLGRLDETERAYNQVLEVRLQLCDRFPTVTAYQHGLAIAYRNRGMIYWQTRRWAECEKDVKESLRLAQQLTEGFPRQRSYRATLGSGQELLSILLMTTGRWSAAEPLCRQNVLLREQLAADFPQVLDYRVRLGASYDRLGRVLRETGAFREAEERYRAAIQLRQQLMTDMPGIPQLRKQLADSYNDLGNLLRDAGRLADALPSYREALALLEGESERFGNSPFYRDDLTTYQNNLAYAYWLGGRSREAEELYRKALPVREQLVAEHPRDVHNRQKLAGTFTNLGRLLRDSERFAEAERAFRSALAHQAKLAADFPETGVHRIILASGQLRLGQFLRDLGRFGEARRQCQEVEARWRKALAVNPRDYTANHQLARFYANCPDPKFRDPVLALELARTTVRLSDRPSPDLWATLGMAYYRAGSWECAAAALTQADRLRRHPDGLGAFFCAMAYWRQGYEDNARAWYARALGSLKQTDSRDEELLRVRAEAAALLGPERLVAPPPAADNPRLNRPRQPVERVAPRGRDGNPAG